MSNVVNEAASVLGGLGKGIRGTWDPETTSRIESRRAGDALMAAREQRYAQQQAEEEAARQQAAEQIIERSRALLGTQAAAAGMAEMGPLAGTPEQQRVMGLQERMADLEAVLPSLSPEAAQMLFQDVAASELQRIDQDARQRLSEQIGGMIEGAGAGEQGPGLAAPAIPEELGMQMLEMLQDPNVPVEAIEQGVAAVREAHQADLKTQQIRTRIDGLVAQFAGPDTPATVANAVGPWMSQYLAFGDLMDDDELIALGNNMLVAGHGDPTGDPLLEAVQRQMIETDEFGQRMSLEDGRELLAQVRSLTQPQQPMPTGPPPEPVITPEIETSLADDLRAGRSLEEALAEAGIDGATPADQLAPQDLEAIMRVRESAVAEEEEPPETALTMGGEEVPNPARVPFDEAKERRSKRVLERLDEQMLEAIRATGFEWEGDLPAAEALEHIRKHVPKDEAERRTLRSVMSALAQIESKG